MDLRISPSAVRRWLLAITAVLLVASTLGQLALQELPSFPFQGGIAHALYVDSEQSLPTLFAVLLLLAAAAVLAVIARVRAHRDLGDVAPWSASAVLVALAALDEFLSLHEQLIEPMRDLLGDRASGLLHFAWVIPAAVAVAAVVVVFVPFLRRLPAATRTPLLVAGGLYLSGALAMEMVGGAIEDSAGDREGYAYLLATTIEEGLELVAVVVVIHTLLTYIAGPLGGLTLRAHVGADREPALR